MNGGGGGGSDTESFGESFANSSGSNWNSNASDSRNINASQSRSSQDVWGPQADALQMKYNETPGVYMQAKQDINNYTPEANQALSTIRGATAPAAANQYGGGELGGRGVANNYMNSMGQSMSGPSNMQQAYNTSAPQLNQMYRQQANDARGDMMNSLDARAAASGMSGGSRHGTAIAQGNQDINQNLQNQMALASDRDVDRGLNVANQADQQLLNRQQMMQGDIGGINAAQQNAIGQTTQLGQAVMQGYQPGQQAMNNLSMGSQIIGGPTTLNQSGTDTLGIGGTQTIGSGGGTNQSDAYSWNSSQSETNPNYNFGIGQGSKT